MVIEILNKINADHAKIMQLLAETTGSYGVNRAALIDEIVDHLTTHASEEEDFMKQTRYPGAAAHALLHAELQDGLMEIFLSSTPAEFQDLTEVTDRLVLHISAEDEKFFEFLRTKCQP